MQFCRIPSGLKPRKALEDVSIEPNKRKLDAGNSKKRVKTQNSRKTERKVTVVRPTSPHNPLGSLPVYSYSTDNFLKLLHTITRHHMTLRLPLLFTR